MSATVKYFRLFSISTGQNVLVLGGGEDGAARRSASAFERSSGAVAGRRGSRHGRRARVNARRVRNHYIAQYQFVPKVTARHVPSMVLLPFPAHTVIWIA